MDDMCFRAYIFVIPYRTDRFCAVFCLKGGVFRDEPMCHAVLHDVCVRLPVLLLLRRLMDSLSKPASQ